MKRILSVVVILTFAFVALSKDTAKDHPLMKSDSVVWAGLDYSIMRLIGDTNTIKVPDLLFEKMPERWNELFLDERIEGVADSLQKRILIDISGVAKRNKELKRDQVNLNADKKNDAILETHISPAEITNLVHSLEMEHKSGLGLIFIVDRFVCQYIPMPVSSSGPDKGKLMATKKSGGAIYVVFFDVASREIISVSREVRAVSTGGSFRNYWFGPVKEVDKDIAAYRR